MRTRYQGTRLDMVKLDRTSVVPLYRQLLEGVQQAILDGTLAAGARLPATRVLTRELGVSRNTVLAAFDQLSTDGYLVTRPSSGAYVAEKPPGGTASPAPRAEAPADQKPAAPPRQASPPTPLLAPVLLAAAKADEGPRPANRASVFAELPLSKLYRSGPPRPFRVGTPDGREFPLELWERLRAQVLRERAGHLLSQADPAGYLPLREALSNYLRQARDVRSIAAQIVITGGVQQALRLVAGVRVTPGDVVAIEEPGYFGAKAAFLDAGARIAPLLVDEEGPITPGVRRHNTPTLIYTTPAHQLPLGVTMTLPRRLGMLGFAKENNVWVVEDDYDSELRYTGRAPDSLHSLDSHGSVIYVGNTSNILSPAMGIGYLVLPTTQVDLFVKANAIAGTAASLVDQATLALFISEGHLAHHVSHLKQVYQSRLSTLRQAIERDLPDVFEFPATAAGLNTMAWLRRSWEEEEVASAAIAAGLELTPLGAFGKTALMRPGVVFGFSAFTVEELEKAVARLVLALRAKRTMRFSVATASSA